MEITIEDLKSCGNCMNYAAPTQTCLKNDKLLHSYCVCQSWEWDGFDEIERVRETNEFIL